jgi:hypothetical protein
MRPSLAIDLKYVKPPLHYAAEFRIRPGVVHRAGSSNARAQTAPALAARRY